MLGLLDVGGTTTGCVGGGRSSTFTLLLEGGARDPGLRDLRAGAIVDCGGEDSAALGVATATLAGGETIAADMFD